MDEKRLKKVLETLLLAAGEAIDDFENYGEVWQQDDNGEYGPESAIAMLRKAYKAARKVMK